jgi:mxaK protein
MTYWALIVVFIASLLFIVNSAIQLVSADKLNNYIAEPDVTNPDTVPDDSLARFALAYQSELQDRPQQALDMYTQLLSNEDKLLAAQAYYNRGIITLKQAASMQDGDPKKIPLIGLAKQDFRHALAIEPKLWDARYNLEAALNLVPELPIDDDPFEKNEISSSRSIEAVGFRVDLP